MENKTTMQIEIWSDVMCPFCYIGKRRFEKALETFGHKDQIEVIWKSFQLDPQLKTQPGKNVIEHLAEVKGWSLAQSREAHDHVTQMAHAEGLDYRFDQAVVANSFDAHRLLQMAKEKGWGDEAEELLFNAYFTQGKNIADPAFLIESGTQLGLQEETITSMLGSDQYADDVHRDVYEAGQIGVRGVPFFLFNKKYGVSGAQPTETFSGALTQAFNEWKQESVQQTTLISEGNSCDTEGTCD
jgi:predicted DsbA family dithiol-disulfide isomerase